MKRVRKLVGAMLVAVIVMGSSYSVQASSGTYIGDECRSPLCYDSTHLEKYHVYFISTGVGSIKKQPVSTRECCR